MTVTVTGIVEPVTVPYVPSGTVDETRVTVGTAVSVRNVFPEVIVVLELPEPSAPETETVVVPSMYVPPVARVTVYA